MKKLTTPWIRFFFKIRKISLSIKTFVSTNLLIRGNFRSVKQHKTIHYKVDAFHQFVR